MKIEEIEKILKAFDESSVWDFSYSNGEEKLSMRKEAAKTQIVPAAVPYAADIAAYAKSESAGGQGVLYSSDYKDETGGLRAASYRDGAVPAGQAVNNHAGQAVNNHTGQPLNNYIGNDAQASEPGVSAQGWVKDAEPAGQAIAVKDAEQAGQGTAVKDAEPAGQGTAVKGEESASQGTVVKAPLAGVFYRAPKPGEKPFVEVGQKVKAGETVGLIEAMKMISEIPAPCAGTVREIRAEDAVFVQFDEELMVIGE